MSDKNAKQPVEADKAPAAGNTPAQEENRPQATEDKPKEYGGPKGPEPTRYGDWERKGIVSDF